MLELAAQRKDGRVLLGCPMDFVGMNDQPTVGGLALTCGIIGDHLPGLRDVAIERVWAGLLPQTPDALPVLGPVDGVEGLVLATGHVFGVAAGPMSGKLIAQHLTGATPALDLAPFRYERPEIADALMERFVAPMPLFTGAAAVGDRLVVLPVLYHLLWRQVLAVDLAAAPLSPGSVVHLAEAAR